ncbi:MAG: hypothetical protein KGI38_10950 [Thaumarchaeota archaeon]|nr:hypothetical protein [Nitrososphaerota archaeon]
MRSLGTPKEALLKAVLVVLVAVVLVPALLQAYIDGAQQWESDTYTATVTSFTSGSPARVSFRTATNGLDETVLTDSCYSVGQVVSAVYHPAVLWGPSYWEIQTPGSC